MGGSAHTLKFGALPYFLSKTKDSLMGGGGGGSGPTLQQQQLETNQAMQTANLNIEENAQRKGLLNSAMGTRVFRGSALSRAVAGNTNGGGSPAPGPSGTQTRGNFPGGVFNFGGSLLDAAGAAASGSTPAGGAGASGGGGSASGGRRGPGSAGVTGVRTV
jgi:hypothetical protein